MRLYSHPVLRCLLFPIRIRHCMRRHPTSPPGVASNCSQHQSTCPRCITRMEGSSSTQRSWSNHIFCLFSLALQTHLPHPLQARLRLRSQPSNPHASTMGRGRRVGMFGMGWWSKVNLCGTSVVRFYRSRPDIRSQDYRCNQCIHCPPLSFLPRQDLSRTRPLLRLYSSRIDAQKRPQTLLRHHQKGPQKGRLPDPTTRFLRTNRRRWPLAPKRQRHRHLRRL